MTPEKWALLKTLFNELISVPPMERRARLEAFDGEPDLRDRLEDLLAHADRSESRLDRPAVDLIGAPDAADDNAPFEQPQLLHGGRFEILRKIGSGGMGTVYEAFDRMLSSRIAIKMLLRSSALSVSLFKQEFRSIAHIQHRNLVTLYEFFAQEEPWFFTMEFVPGATFLDFVRGQPADTKSERLREAFAQVAEGLAALHEAGKLHCDIKPGNVIVSDAGRAVLLDFGLVSDLESPLANAALAGTPAYMSPERVLGERMTPASDWYSAAVMLYEALFGARVPSAIVRLRGQQCGESGFTPPVSGVAGDLHELCLQMLALRPEDRPRADEILHRLSCSPLPPVHGAAKPARRDPSLLGREAEMRQLALGFERSRSEPVIVSITGESGIGKSALIGRFVSDWSARSGVTVLRGRCYDRESMPFNAFDELIDGLSAFLAGLTAERLSAIQPPDFALLCRVFPVFRALDPSQTEDAPPQDRRQLRRRAFTAFRELIRRVAGLTRLVLCIDDLQWGDPDSAALLGELFAVDDPPDILLVVASRTAGASPCAFLRSFFEELARTSRLEPVNLHLEVLGADAAAALAAAALEDAGFREHPEPLVQRIARESQGNPYLLQQLAQYTSEIGAATDPQVEPAVNLGAAVRSRIEELPDSARRLLEVVAVCGRPVRDSVAMEAAERPSDSLRWLTLLRTRKFIRAMTIGENEAFEPYHDRLRDAVLGEIPDGRLKRHHLHVAVALENSGDAEPESLATHFEAAGEPDQAGKYYVRAGRNAFESLAFHNASNLLGKGLSLAAYTPEERAGVQTLLGEALANSGRGFQAAQAFEQSSLADPEAGLSGLCRAGYHYAASGHVAEGKRALTPALERLGISLPLESKWSVLTLMAVRALLRAYEPVWAGRVRSVRDPVDIARIDLCWYIGTGLGLVELMTGAIFTSYSLYLALRAGDPSRIARGLAWEAAIAASQSHSGKRRAVRLLASCRTLLTRRHNPHSAAMLLLCEGQAHFSHGQWDPALANFDEADKLFTGQCRGVSFELATLHGFRLQTLVYRGNYRALRALTAECLDLARTSGDLYLETFIQGAIQPLLFLTDDRPDLAARSTEEALRKWTTPGYHLQHALIDQVRAWTALYAGNRSQADEILRSQWSALRKSHLLLNQNLRGKMVELRARTSLASAIRSHGAPPDLRPAKKFLAQLDREREPYMAGSRESLRAMIAHLQGDSHRAVELLGAAAKEFDSWKMADFAAASRVVLAAYSRDAGHGECGKQAIEWMADQQIRNPRRWAQMRIPLPI